MPGEGAREEGSEGAVAGSGRTYLLDCLEALRAEQEQQARAKALAVDLTSPFVALASASTQRLMPTPRQLVQAAFLVPKDQVSRVSECVQALARRYPDVRLLCTGPWPPYHFVQL